MGALALLRGAFLSAALLGVACLASACGPGENAAAGPQQPQQPVQVEAGSARIGSAQRTVDVVGTLYGEEESVVSNKVPGKVIAIYKDIGDRAEPGEPLAQLLRNDYLLTINLRRSALTESLAKLGVSELPGSDYDVTTLPAVRRAKLQSDSAEAKFNRGRQLFEQTPPLVSQQDFEDLRTALEVARSNYDVELATAQGLLAEARTRQAEVRIAEQALADATIKAPQEIYPSPDRGPATRPVESAGVPESAVASALASADESSAPAAGQPPRLDPSAVARPATRTAANQTGRYVVTSRSAQLGELFSPITPMFKLVKDDPLKLRAAVPARYFPEIGVGQSVTVRADSYPSQHFEGVVTRVNPQVDQASRTFSIEVTLPNSDAANRIPAGDFARGSIRTRSDSGVVFVPASAIVSFAGNDKVFVLADGKAKEVQVKLGTRIKRPDGGEDVEVLPDPKGLKGKEQLAVGGAMNRLATGVPVQVKAAPTTKPAEK